MNGKMRSASGVARFVWIVAAITLVMLIIVAIPGWRYYKSIADEIGCLTALDSAWRQMAVDYLANNQNPTAEEVKEVVTYAMDGWEDLCPGGGNVYVHATGEDDVTGVPYELVCGIHGEQPKRCRLNADYAMELLETQLRTMRLRNQTPGDVTVKLNGKELTITLLEEPNNLRRGTDATIDYDGITAFYCLDGDDRIEWFVYADPDYAAVWQERDGWTGTAYSQ